MRLNNIHILSILAVAQGKKAPQVPQTPPPGLPLKIVLSNDDGFESANIQALYFALEGAGHNVM